MLKNLFCGANVNGTQVYHQRTGKWIVVLLLLATRLSLIDSSAQGLPLIRNYSAAEYGGHNRCFDIEIGDDGTVFVANFEGLLYYDRSRWRMIYTPELV